MEAELFSLSGDALAALSTVCVASTSVRLVISSQEQGWICF